MPAMTRTGAGTATNAVGSTRPTGLEMAAARCTECGRIMWLGRLGQMRLYARDLAFEFGDALCALAQLCSLRVRDLPSCLHSHSGSSVFSYLAIHHRLCL